MLLSTFMEELGFETRAASNGQEAVDIWSEWQPHLIWMDIRMPVMNGIEATERIKADPRGRETKVVALTASVFHDERERILSHGCDDFVRKPFREQELVKILAEHLGLRFVYADGKNAEPHKAVPSDAPDLLELHDELLEELRSAALRADADRIYELLEPWREEHPDASGVIAELVHEYRFDEILRLTEGKQ